MKIQNLLAAAALVTAVAVPTLGEAQIHHPHTVVVRRHGHVVAVRHYHPHRHVVVVRHHPMHHGRTVIIHH